MSKLDDGNDNTASTNHPGTPTFSTGKPLTIVTAIAGGLLLLLLLLISIVACQRKRLNRRRSGRSGRRRLSSDVDRMSFVYSNNVHVMLPSYDEAMQNQRLNFPPPYAADAASTVQPNATEETPNAASTTTAQQERNGTHTILYILGVAIDLVYLILKSLRFATPPLLLKLTVTFLH